MYEYRAVTRFIYEPPIEEQYLNKEAKTGWRLITVAYDTLGNSRYYWERKIPWTEKSSSKEPYCKACGNCHNPEVECFTK